MLKKSITYEDFNGNTVTDVFYFNLTKTELIKMELSENDGFAQLMQRIVDAKNNGEIVAVFERIILASYGEKTADGKSFEKFDVNGNPLSRKFAQTAAYDAMFFEFIEKQEEAEKFIRGIMPANIDPIDGVIKTTEEQINDALKANGIPSLPPPAPSV